MHLRCSVASRYHESKAWAKGADFPYIFLKSETEVRVVTKKKTTKNKMKKSQPVFHTFNPFMWVLFSTVQAASCVK